MYNGTLILIVPVQFTYGFQDILGVEFGMKSQSALKLR